MNKEQKNVKQLMEQFDQDCPSKPVQLDEATAKLRASLILEEALETITKGLGLEVAILSELDSEWNTQYIDADNLKEVQIVFHKRNEVDLIELADGCADIQVVTLGTTLAAGIDQEPIDQEVQDSNMSKLFREKDLEQGIKDNPGCTYKHVRDDLYMLKSSIGKFVKAPTYFAPNLKAIIEEQSK